MPGKSHGCPWGREESDTTERLHFHFSLSCIGDGNGNPLQCSCLENPRDRGALWAAVYGVAQSWTRLKRLSSSRNVLDRTPTKGQDLCTCFISCILTSIPPGQESIGFLYKGPENKIKKKKNLQVIESCSFKVSGATTQPCHWRVKIAIDIRKQTSIGGLSRWLSGKASGIRLPSRRPGFDP